MVQVLGSWYSRRAGGELDEQRVKVKIIQGSRAGQDCWGGVTVPGGRGSCAFLPRWITCAQLYSSLLTDGLDPSPRKRAQPSHLAAGRCEAWTENHWRKSSWRKVWPLLAQSMFCRQYRCYLANWMGSPQELLDWKHQRQDMEEL
ncbi:uncharacterized protein LOC144456201 [Phascolarctos cinereus]